MNAIYSRFGLILIVLCFFCAGCTKHHINLEPAVAEAVQSMMVVSVIPQDEIEIHVRQAQTGGALFGLLGALVDAGVTSSRRSEAEDIAFQLRAASEDLDFRELFWGEIENVFKASVWPARFELRRVTEPMDDDELKDVIATNDMDGVLVVSTEYFLTPSVTILAIRSTAELYIGAGLKREYLGTFAYLSDEILADEAGDEKRWAGKLWAKDDATRFKDEIRRGTVETMRMIQYDLIDRKYEETLTGEKVKFTYEDPDGIEDEITVTARLITTVGGRAFFRGKKGNLFSMPETWTAVLDRSRSGYP